MFVVACVMFAALVSPMPAAAAQWHEVRTEDFHIISVVGTRQTRRIVDDVLLYQGGMGKALKHMDVRPKLPTTVLLLNARLWNQYMPLGPGKAGVVYARPAAIDVVVNADSWLSASPIVFHELTHVVLHQNARGKRLPAWYNEGYADFFSTLRKKGDSLDVGLPPWWRWLSLKQRPWMPLQQVLTVDQGSREYQEDRLAEAFYAASWLMIHYGMFENSQRSQQLERYRTLLSEGLSQQRALQLAFPDGLDEFDKELQAYGKRTKFNYFNLALPEIARIDVDAIVPLAEADAMNALVAAMLVANFTGNEQLRLVSGLAAHAAPDSVAMMQLAAVHEARNEGAQALALAEKGCAATPSNVRVAMLCGEVYYQSAYLPQATAEQRDAYIKNARRHYEFVLNAEPDNVAGLLSMSRTMEFAPLADNKAREGLERLWQRSLRTAEIAYSIAWLYSVDDLHKSKDYLEQALLLAQSPTMERMILDRLHYVESAL